MSVPRSNSPHRLVIAAALLFCLVAGFWLFAVRIEPSALVLRTYYEKFSAATAVETDHFRPSVEIRRKGGQNYGDGGADTQFDVYRPVSARNEKLPTVVWIHGGGWVAGTKNDVEPYLRKIASAQFTVVALNYPLAPANEFPSATIAINQALKYLTDRSALYGIDSSQLILAGNGAGANLASQLAALSTNPTYAQTLGITPSIRSSQIRGVVLNGGIYDVGALASLTGPAHWTTRAELWAYTGDRDVFGSPDVPLISTSKWVTPHFPSTWITSGDADPKTPTQAQAFANLLTQTGVPTTAIFPDPGSSMPSDYQFMLGSPQAKRAFASMLDFMHEVTAPVR